jgi:hypothetical protein
VADRPSIELSFTEVEEYDENRSPSLTLAMAALNMTMAINTIPTNSRFIDDSGSCSYEIDIRKSLKGNGLFYSNRLRKLHA